MITTDLRRLYTTKNMFSNRQMRLSILLSFSPKHCTIEPKVRKA